jgi:hypothetical protein
MFEKKASNKYNYNSKTPKKNRKIEEDIELMNFARNNLIFDKPKEDLKIKQSIIESRKNSIIKKFHKIYSNITGKKFIVENSKDNFIEMHYRKKLKQFEFLLGIVSLMSVFNAVGHYELTYSPSGYDNIRNIYSPLLYSCTGLTIILMMLIYFSEKTYLEYEKDIQKIQKVENLYSTGRYLRILIKFLITICHPNIFCEGVVFKLYNQNTSHTITRSINSLLTIISFLRFLFVFRGFLFQSSYLDPDTNKICRMHNFEPQFLFNLKSMIKDSPLKIYFLTLVIFVFIFSYSIRIFERAIETYNFNNYWNSIWYVFVTMATVGYGDMTAKTNEGRVIVMISCAVGCYLISMMIVAVTNVFTFEINEINAFIILEKAEGLSQTDETAKKVVFNFTKTLSKYSFKQLMANEPQKLKNLFKNLKKFKKFMYNSYCSDSNRDYDCFYNNLNFIDIKQESILKSKVKREIEIEEIKNKIIKLADKGMKIKNGLKKSKN